VQHFITLMDSMKLNMVAVDQVTLASNLEAVSPVQTHLQGPMWDNPHLVMTCNEEGAIV